MVSHYEYSLFCIGIYEILANKHSPTTQELNKKGWELAPLFLDEPVTDYDKSYFVTLWVNKNTAQAVAVFRSTSNKQNIVENLIALLTLHESLHSYAEKFMQLCVKYCEDKQLTLTCTGHGVGAYLAEIEAYRHAKEVVTFESPGSQQAIENLPLLKSFEAITYLSAPNIFNTTWPHSAAIRRLPHIDNKFNVPMYIEKHHLMLDTRSLSFELLFGLTKAAMEHSLDKIVKDFNPETGEAFQYGKVYEWPIAKNEIFFPTADKEYPYLIHVSKGYQHYLVYPGI